uniref:Uncharacterized protein n=1 Tax=Amphimedon queenslandica TaxID=400682 RepID=A0A1X7TJC0_AMPQE
MYYWLTQLPHDLSLLLLTESRAPQL